MQATEELFDGGVHGRQAEVTHGVAAEAAGVLDDFVARETDAVFDERR